jgi:signal transduction histidine kinase
MLQRNSADVTLIIEDDGLGFDPARSQVEHRGLGLSGMRERLALVGGTLKIDSRSQHGTRVTATAPVEG